MLVMAIKLAHVASAVPVGNSYRTITFRQGIPLVPAESREAEGQADSRFADLNHEILGCRMMGHNR